jgi:hypothetical protein
MPCGIIHPIEQNNRARISTYWTLAGEANEPLDIEGIPFYLTSVEKLKECSKPSQSLLLQR